ncbi:MAG: deoxyguanosinetriphosphate triphosphohydrolase [Eubacteriales bacterium]|nr:deoxyguanosinetriphosphate triphosphohydrolase [Eubacteriales bacterium]
MTIREQLEQEEAVRLSPLAAHARDSRGRETPMEPCPLRTDYQRDRDRILHCKSFRRLKFKTQVFLSPEGDHYRTRLTHTLEVAQVARTMARALRLNEDLTEAIALGHDLGHTPFGHIGERSLDELMPDGFRHNEQSRRCVEVLENGGAGLNLTWEVRDGILCHSGKQFPATLEGQCVRRADRIAYLNHDLDDALRGGVLQPFELPADCLKVLGQTHGQRINTMILDIVENSQGQDVLTMSPLVQEAMDGLREFMFERVYRDKWRAAEEHRCDLVMTQLFHYYSEHPGEMPEEYVLIGYREGMERGVCDFLSGMTDRYAVRTYQQLFVPAAFPAL